MRALPIVRGDVETRKQIVWYSFVMVAVTAVLVPFGLMGAIYLVAALLLGGVFVYYAVRLRREETPITSTPAAPPTTAISIAPAPPAPDSAGRSGDSR